MDRDPHVVPRAYLTDDLPGIGGRIKQRPEDFLVEESPLYDPVGEGEHIYMFIEKRSMSTLELVALLARHFGVPKRAIGYAGLKDKQAITRQVLSVHVPGKRIEDFPQIRDERVGVLWSDYHSNKLRRGHLRGNRFSIRVRGVSPTSVIDAKRTLDRLASVGVPNRIAEQRFGVLGNNHLIGRWLILGDDRATLDELLGPPAGDSDLRSATQARAREAYTSGDYEQALAMMPRSLRAERAALRVLARGGDARRAVRAIGAPAIEYYLSATQSAAFNAVLDARLDSGSLGELGPGDVAFKHDSRAAFDVDAQTASDPETRRRLDSFEISPSGPMWGAQMKRAQGDVDRAEVAALGALGLTPDDLERFVESSRLSMPGERRSLRVPLIAPEIEGGADEHGSYVRCAFELPRGSFATTVMAEIIKPVRRLAVGDDSQGMQHES